MLKYQIIKSIIMVIGTNPKKFVDDDGTLRVSPSLGHHIRRIISGAS